MATISISFTEPTPAPANGYRVRYREVGTTPYTTVTGSSSPINIVVADGLNWEGTLESDCGDGFSVPVPWSVDSLICATITAVPELAENQTEPGQEEWFVRVTLDRVYDQDITVEGNIGGATYTIIVPAGDLTATSPENGTFMQPEGSGTPTVMISAITPTTATSDGVTYDTQCSLNN